MPITERISSSKRSFNIPTPSENVLLAIVAGAFIAFHILVGVMVHRALPAAAEQPEKVIVTYGD